MQTANILIADDHELVRDGIKARIQSQPGWRVCAEAVNGRQAVEMAANLKPHIAILDIGMSELNGLAATRLIRKACPQTEVLILTMQESRDLVHEALEAGARGFVLKTDASRLLISAIESLLDHKPFFTGSVSDVVLAGFLDPAGSSGARETALQRLTPRETEIVQLLAEARTSKEAAARLGISTNTIEAHRANIMRKLNLHSIAELVRYAIRHRIIQP
jgi:DNA-binding NarL/FixJ family response regulator